MNKIIMMGRLTKDPEVRYAGEKNTATARYSIAVERRFKREEDPDADFFNLVSFGKTAEFVEKYLRKGTKIVVEGEVRNNNYTNKDGQMVYSNEFLINSVEFAESKAAASNNAPAPAPSPAPDGDGFMNIPNGVEEELPFN